MVAETFVPAFTHVFNTFFQPHLGGPTVAFEALSRYIIYKLLRTFRISSLDFSKLFDKSPYSVDIFIIRPQIVIETSF